MPSWRWLPPPGTRMRRQRRSHTDSSDFSGFVFKIQANMGPNHRDRIAFLRIVSKHVSKKEYGSETHAREKSICAWHNLNNFWRRSTNQLKKLMPVTSSVSLIPATFALVTVCAPGSNIEFADIPIFPPNILPEFSPKIR